jgi:hypothetical protein
MAIISNPNDPARYLPGRGLSSNPQNKPIKSAQPSGQGTDAPQLKPGDKLGVATVLAYDVQQGYRVRMPDGKEKTVPANTTAALVPYVTDNKLSVVDAVKGGVTDIKEYSGWSVKQEDMDGAKTTLEQQKKFEPYTSADGKLDLLSAVKGGITNPSEYTGWTVTQENIDSAKSEITRQAAADKLAPYKSADNTYDVYKAVKGGVDAETLSVALGVSAEDYKTIKATAPYVTQKDGVTTVNLQAVLDDLNGKKTVPTDLKLPQGSISTTKLDAALSRMNISASSAKDLLGKLSKYQLADADKTRLDKYIKGFQNSIDSYIASPAGQMVRDRVQDKMQQLQDKYGDRVPARTISKEIKASANPDVLIAAMEKQFGVSIIKGSGGYTIKQEPSTASVAPDRGPVALIPKDLPSGVTQTDVDDMQAKLAASQAEMDAILAGKDPGEALNTKDPDAYVRYLALQAQADALSGSLKALKGYTSGDPAYSEVPSVITVDDIRAIIKQSDPELTKYLTASQSYTGKDPLKAAGFDLVKARTDGIDDKRLLELGYSASDLKMVDTQIKVSKLLPDGITNYEGVNLALQAGIKEDELKAIGITQDYINGAVSWQVLVDKGYVNAAGEVNIAKAQADGYDAQIIGAGFTQEALKEARDFNMRVDKLAKFIDSKGTLDLDAAVAAGHWKAEDYEGWTVTQDDINKVLKERAQYAVDMANYHKDLTVAGRELLASMPVYTGGHEITAEADAFEPYKQGSGYNVVAYLQDNKTSLDAIKTAGIVFPAATVAEAVKYSKALDALGKYGDDPTNALWGGNPSDIAAFALVYPDYDITETPAAKIGRTVELIEGKLQQKVFKDMGFGVTTNTDLEAELARTAGRLGITYDDPDLGYATGKRWDKLTAAEKDLVAAAYSPETTMAAPLHQISQTPAKVTKSVQQWIETHVSTEDQQIVGKYLNNVAQHTPIGMIWLNPIGETVIGIAKDAVIGSQEAYALYANKRGGFAKTFNHFASGVYDLTSGLAAVIPMAAISSVGDISKGKVAKGIGELSGLGVGFVTWPADLGKGIVVDPDSGAAYAAGIFLGPAAIAKYLNKTRTYIDPYGIPQEGISIEYATGRIPAHEYAKWVSGKIKAGEFPKGYLEDTLQGKPPEIVKEAARQFLVKALKSYKDNPDGVIKIKYKGVEVTGRITPMEAVREGIAWHGTENLTPYRALKPGQDITVSPSGLYFDPFASPRFLAGGAGGRPIVDPGYVMLLTEPNSIKYLASNPSPGVKTKPGMYSPGSLYKGGVETQIIAAPETKLTKAPLNLRQRMLMGKGTEFFTTYSGPSVVGLRDGQIVPITVLLDKGIPGAKVPTPKELYAMKLAILKATLDDFKTSIKNPGRTLRDIVTRRFGPPGVRDADIDYYKIEYEKAMREARQNDKSMSESEAYTKTAEEVLEEILKENPELEKEYATPEGRRNLEKLYRAALERMIRGWAAGYRRTDISRESLIRELNRVRDNVERQNREILERREAERTAPDRRLERREIKREPLRREMERLTVPRREDARDTDRRVTERTLIPRVTPPRAELQRAELPRVNPPRIELPRANPPRVNPPRVELPRRTPPRTPPTPVPPRPQPRRTNTKTSDNSLRNKVDESSPERRNKLGPGDLAWRQGAFWYHIIPHKHGNVETYEKIITRKPPEFAETLKRLPQETYIDRGILPAKLGLEMGAFDVKILPNGMPNLKFLRNRKSRR